VLAVAVMAVAESLEASSRQSSDTNGNYYATALAQQLMEEMSARAFSITAGQDLPGFSTTVADRANYDDLDDYQGYWDTCKLNTDNSITITNGTVNSACPALTNSSTGKYFRRSVSIKYCSTPTGASVNGGNLAVVTVTVKVDTGESVQLKRLFANTTISK